MPRRRFRARGRPMRRRTGRRAKGYRPSTSWNSKAMARLNARGGTKALTGFPERMTVTLPYVLAGRVNPGVVAYSDQVFSLNSVFDPDTTGVGHQPRGFDQWSAVYGSYRVSKVDVNLLCRQRAAHGINVRAITNNQSASLGSDFNVAEFLNHIYLGQTATNTPPIQRKMTFYPHKVVGKAWSQYISDENTQALVSANPATQAYVHFIIQQVDATTVLDMEYEIQVTYRVTFFNRQNLAIS